MLQNNAMTGLLFLTGIFYNSWLLGLGALIGVLMSTATAFILNYKKADIYNGLYGFNGILLGIALFFFFKINILLIIFVIFGSVLSSVIMDYMHNRNLSPFTFPFVLSAWIIIILIKSFNLTTQTTQELIKTTHLNVLSSLSMGFGQVMFQASVITGIIFLLAILINSRITAIYGFIGSLIGLLLAFTLSFPLNLINAGIFGYNGVLCGIASAEKKRFSWLYTIISIIISVFIIYGMTTINWIAFTAPFVFATWITLALKKIVKTQRVQS